MQLICSYRTHNYGTLPACIVQADLTIQVFILGNAPRLSPFNKGLIFNPFLLGIVTKFQWTGHTNKKTGYLNIVYREIFAVKNFSVVTWAAKINT